MGKSDNWELSGRRIMDWIPEDIGITINAEAVEKQMDRVQGLVELRQTYRGAIREIVTKLETLDEEFEVRYAHNPIHQIKSRLKTPQSIMEKLRRKNLPMDIKAAQEHLTDIAGVRVICNYLADIYDIADMLEKQSDVIPVGRRDHIANPKENGYRSLHLIVRIPVYLTDRVETVPVEVQIRTIAMDFWATLEHELRYKSTNNVPASVVDRLKQCAEASAALDLEMQSIRNDCLGL